MIRLNKSGDGPDSLQRTSRYDGEDVKKQLFADQHSKCYLCERRLVTDFQIEHFRSQENFVEQRQNWKNLLLSCGYCNRKKSCRYDDLVNPLDTDVEVEISQRIDYVANKAVFETSVDDNAHRKTIALLNSICNGKNGLRNLKEENFYHVLTGEMNHFLRIVGKYLDSPGIEQENLLRAELSLDQEFLGFKYWVIKDNPKLMEVFEKDLVWNK